MGILGRGDEPWAGALVLHTLAVGATVVAAGAALNGLIGLATIVAPSANTTARGHRGAGENNLRRNKKQRYYNVTRDKEQ